MHYDVIVVGGGTAGAVAAISAARTGAKTLVIDRNGGLGGTQSYGWVTPMMPNYLGDHKLNRGANLEVIHAQTELQPADEELLHSDVWYDPVMLAAVYDELLLQAGVNVLFNANLLSASVKNRCVESIQVHASGEVLTFHSKCFIDCSGDASLAVASGAECMSGNDQGVHQPMTLRFKMGNIDLVAAAQGADFWRVNRAGYLETGFFESKESPIGDWVIAAIQQGILHEDDLGYFQIFTMNGCPGEMAFNCPRISGLDPLDPFELSQAYIVGRAKIRRIAAFMQSFFPGFEKAFISGIAPMMGIRESRRVVGEYILTAEDHQTCRKFDDTIARNRYPVDIHLDKSVDFKPLPKGDFHDIPYRCLVVKGFDNLWVAGRCLSADFVAQSSVRIQPVCRAMGEAAGIAAALCAQRDIAAQDLPYPDLAGLLDLSLPAGFGLASGKNQGSSPLTGL